MQGIWYQNSFEKITECGGAQNTNAEAMTVDRDPISGKKGSNEIIPRMDNCLTIANYATLDRFDEIKCIRNVT
jgi:hypothetical protein